MPLIFNNGVSGVEGVQGYHFWSSFQRTSYTNELSLIEYTAEQFSVDQFSQTPSYNLELIRPFVQNKTGLIVEDNFIQKSSAVTYQ